MRQHAPSAFSASGVGLDRMFSDFSCTLVTWKGNPNVFTQTVSHWVGLVESKNLFLSRLIKQIFKYLYYAEIFFKKELSWEKQSIPITTLKNKHMKKRRHQGYTSNYTRMVR